MKDLSEKEKMLGGMLYDAVGDPRLVAERMRAKELCFDFNHTRPSARDRQQGILHSLLGRVGAFCTVVAPFWCDYGYNIEVGDHFFANHNCVILDCAKVSFGDYVFIAPHCGFHTAGHPLDSGRRNQGLEYAHPICVGDGVWFGAGVQVLPGVQIGNNVVVAAGSVVTGDIPDNVLAAGVPCRVIRTIGELDARNRHRFDREGGQY